ncbi:MAG: hypothetical protein Q7S75_01515 [bacterium]|nr:hypothetical protein [bacterium]
MENFSKRFGSKDQKEAVNSKPEKPESGILAKAHKLLLGAVLATGVSSASAVENNGHPEAFSNSVHNSTPDVARSKRFDNGGFSNSPNAEENRRINGGNKTGGGREDFSNPSDKTKKGSVDNRDRTGKAREDFSNSLDVNKNIRANDRNNTGKAREDFSN